ncbi:holo-[acyl-carrier-protein] synthase [Fimbriimonadia bacterium ATM]|nr:MAG: holo-[acyl-carrier-protein] synthase [Armatimonadota bacterium]MBC6968591.1 holo-[acyl-carrier-protein] synthase [Armatimonadota bacterium]MCE7898570.1 holo-[acyl-carrier-protein] synthase [Armatimonadetes bacterium ATM1]MDL1928137.1 holo-[acyl-carrier-protein] synthase [Fimbriimonadia bacterium ATM]RIJ98298.1 MAG: holo-[acyl-carrier-protein] synthase [Armatimonadota bacterium]
MIRGLGIDVVEVSRIADAMRKPRFLERILTQRERSGSLTPAFVAGRWAAKEAVAKAVHTNLRWHDVEIDNDESGRPIAVLLRDPNWDASIAPTPSLVSAAHRVSSQIHLSISHERGLAAAVAVWEEKS